MLFFTVIDCFLTNEGAKTLKNCYQINSYIKLINHRIEDYEHMRQSKHAEILEMTSNLEKIEEAMMVCDRKTASVEDMNIRKNIDLENAIHEYNINRGTYEVIEIKQTEIKSTIYGNRGTHDKWDGADFKWWIHHVVFRTNWFNVTVKSRKNESGSKPWRKFSPYKTGPVWGGYIHSKCWINFSAQSRRDLPSQNKACLKLTHLCKTPRIKKGRTHTFHREK